MLEYFFIAFIVIFCIQCLFYIFIFGSFTFLGSNILTKISFKEPVSVIICAKNEAKNLTNNLPAFLNQCYENFELVLINDGSYDQTLEVMKTFKKKSTIPIKIVDVVPNENFYGSKKYALTLGIKVARHKHLLFSDADCKPLSSSWIAEITAQFNDETHLILGYGAYQKIKRSVLNKLIRFETILTAIQYFSYAKIGIPYMGVGRNLAYTKQLFFRAKGFSGHLKIRSGDDDLFVNEVATRKNTAICYSANSTTMSDPETSFRKWIGQKRRHISTASHYKSGHIFLLSLFFFSQFTFWGLGIALLCIPSYWKIGALIIATRIAIQYLSLGFGAKKLNEKDLIWAIPFLELFLILIQLIIFIKNLISKPYNW